MIVYHELPSLCADLKLSPRLLYSLSNSIHNHYHKVKIPKRTGGFRTLFVPDEKLKMVQRKIYETLLLPLPISPYASAYAPGRGIRRNALPHVGQKTVLKLDIHHFFDSILFKDVKEYAFPESIYSEPLRVLLTMLCYGTDELPQGAVTSPAVSNLIMKTFDDAVGSFAKERKIQYTRYSDDLTFSGDFDPKEVISFVSRELRKRGFFLNKKKTVIAGAGQRQIVTGLSVNDKLNLPPAELKKIRQEMYYLTKFGLEDHLKRIQSEDSPEKYVSRLLGRVNYALSIRDDETMREYRKTLSDLMKKHASTKEKKVPEISLKYTRESVGQIARGIFESYDHWRDGTVILTGSGNNGAIGYALAVVLASERIQCQVLSVNDKRTKVGAWYELVAKKLGVEVELFNSRARKWRSSPVIVDCLLGSKVSGKIKPVYLSAIMSINIARNNGAFVISAEINSGMNSEAGRNESAVKSGLTVFVKAMGEGLRFKKDSKYMNETKFILIG